MQAVSLVCICCLFVHVEKGLGWEKATNQAGGILFHIMLTDIKSEVIWDDNMCTTMVFMFIFWTRNRNVSFTFCHKWLLRFKMADGADDSPVLSAVFYLFGHIKKKVNGRKNNPKLCLTMFIITINMARIIPHSSCHLLQKHCSH